jgi:hypothetical protein
MKLAAGVVTYGDWLGLQRTLSGLWGCDIIFVIHARFKNNPVEIPESLAMTDDAISLSQFRNYDIRLSHFDGQTEVECRSMLPQFCKENGCDYLFIVDSDEYVLDPSAQNWGAFRFNIQHVAETTYNKEHNIFGIWETIGFSGSTQNWTYYPRIWYKPWEMMYKSGSHFRFINKNDEEHYYDDWSTQAEKIIEGIRLVHSHDLRIPEMLLGREKYHEWLKEEEGRIGVKYLNRPIGKGYSLLS